MTRRFHPAWVVAGITRVKFGDFAMTFYVSGFLYEITAMAVLKITKSQPSDFLIQNKV